jgi:CBS domain containing-hemolysin-like protein
MMDLWARGAVAAQELWLFAYEDGFRDYLPRAVESASSVLHLPNEVWRKKHEIITTVYGFATDTFESRTTPRTEAFWVFETRDSAREWLDDMKEAP